ncbi:MAG: PucR family transcriptional regulator [Peptostreptococcaceae bacterium]|nr:PucR family transcriptional regulator [Peptostreptococcaceae bacterium]
MSITVKDCLNLPSLSLGRVMTGEQGLDNIVNVVDVIEFVLDEDIMDTPNTLFITAFYAVKDDVDAQCRELSTYKRLGASAMVIFYQGLVVHSLDPRVIQTATSLDLPIIGLPGSNLELHYCNIIEEVMEAIFIDRNEKQKFLNTTLNMILQLSPAKQSITTLLEFASSFTKSTLFLCNQNLRLVSCAHWPRNFSEISLQDVVSLFGPPRFSNSMNTVRHSPDGDSYHMKTFTGKSQTKLVLYAYSQNNVLSSSLINQIVEMIQVFVSVWNYDLDFSKHNSIITVILEGNNALAEQLSADYNLHLSEYNTLLILDDLGIENIEDHVHNVQEQIQKFFPRASVLMDLLRDAIIVLINVPHDTEIDIKAIPFTNIFKCHFSVCGKMFDPLKLNAFYTEYCNSKNSAVLIYPNKKDFSVEQIDFADWCTQFSKINSTKKEAYLTKIRPLLINKNADLLYTLSSYLLDGDSEVKKTSELLHLHRNTIQNRLQKVYELTGLSLTILPDSYILYVASALQRINNQNI